MLRCVIRVVFHDNLEDWAGTMTLSLLVYVAALVSMHYLNGVWLWPFR